jgi:DNA anti-recombination protein RmuC
MIINARYSARNEAGFPPMRRTANALAVETEEVPVSSNELLEANVAAIRTDLTDLKDEFRAVVARLDQDIRALATKAESEIKTAVARIDQQFSRVDEQFREVRQDIRELRADNKTLRDKIDENHTSLDKKIDENHRTLDKKIDENHKTLDQKIDENHKTLDQKIDENHKTLDQKIDENHKEVRADIKEMNGSIAGLRSMQKAILWVLGSILALIGISGPGLTIAKALGWV